MELSAADLKFLHRLRQTDFRNFKSKSGTRIICLLVPLLLPKFVSEVPQCITNFGSGALASGTFRSTAGLNFAAPVLFNGDVRAPRTSSPSFKSKPMRPITFALIIAALSFSVARASAQAVDPASCTAGNATSDQRIAACSAAIAANRGTAQEISSAYAERALALEDKGHRDRAMSDVNEALRVDPNSATAFRVRGELYRRAGKLDLALADFNQAIRIDPTLARAFDGRGNTFNNKREYDRAIEDYNEAVRLNPDYAQTYSNRGAAYYFKGQYERAIADHDEAIRRDPNNARAFSNRGAALKKLGQTDRAIAD